MQGDCGNVNVSLDPEMIKELIEKEKNKIVEKDLIEGKNIFERVLGLLRR